MAQGQAGLHTGQTVPRFLLISFCGHSWNVSRGFQTNTSPAQPSPAQPARHCPPNPTSHLSYIPHPTSHIHTPHTHAPHILPQSLNPPSTNLPTPPTTTKHRAPSTKHFLRRASLCPCLGFSLLSSFFFSPRHLVARPSPSDPHPASPSAGATLSPSSQQPFSYSSSSSTTR
ncbi:hypothetical protein EDB80DRAFT_393276 [Ilyonectria destructans]|nr:hypothetical protein EDB80DRAFT_393276 [Ilyonectria destructans]